MDFFCKFYHFLNTTTVPFSAFVMVVIAVDRYLCICHPFLHWMTQLRAKIIIACLALFIFCIGGIICAQYSIYGEKHLDIFPEVDALNSTYSTNVTLKPGSGNATLVTMAAGGNGPGSGSGSGVGAGAGGGGGDGEGGGGGGGGGGGRGVPAGTVFTKEQCDRRDNTINKDFFNALQRIYSGFFLVSCVAVLILYSLIYHSVVTQRRKKLKIRSANCCFLWDSPGVANGEPSEVTAALELSHVNGENTKIRPDDFTTGGGGGGEESQQAPTNGSSRAPLSRTRIERMRMANIKTALMLFVVTLVFIFSFLPSWLIALKIIEAPVMVFYMYFFYNVVNPIIYAFMNQNFRTELKKMFRCRH